MLYIGKSILSGHWLSIIESIKSSYQKSRRMFAGIPTMKNMAKSGMNPKTLQYLMGHSDIGVTLNTYTHLGAEDAKEELGKYAKMA